MGAVRLSARIIGFKLESDVREVWLNQARVLAPKLDGEKLWVTLRAYPLLLWKRAEQAEMATED